MTEQEEQVSSSHNTDGIQPPDMWSKLNGDPYQRVSMGIGDAINLSGAAIYLGRRDGTFTWNCFEERSKSIRSIFAKSPEVSVVTMPDWAISLLFPSCHSLLINREVSSPIESKIDLFEHIYESHGIPYEVRWDLCPVAEAAKIVPQDPIPCDRYCFVHECPELGYLVDRSLLPKDLPWFGPNPGLEMSILAYVELLQSASEIHVIDSSFMHLVESIEVKAPLFLHNYAKKTYVAGWNDYRMRHAWSIIR